MPPRFKVRKPINLCRVIDLLPMFWMEFGTSENISSRELPYRSGLVTSNTTQKYGSWVVRAKLPTSKGMWPAIWLLSVAPWPSEGEIDITENRGTQPTLTSSAFHYGTNQPFKNSFHTLSVEWDRVESNPRLLIGISDQASDDVEENSEDVACSMAELIASFPESTADLAII